jgi:uncharacterized MAPEG superfamily protein
MTDFHLTHAPDSIVALVWFALWTIVLVLGIGARRFAELRKGAHPTSFRAGERHGSESYWRLYRAHANALENLPIFAVVVLTGWVVGMETKTFNQLAVVVLIARIVQSTIHIASGHTYAIFFRFAAYAAQIACMIWMAVLVLEKAGGL